MIYSYNALVVKALVLFDIGDILRNSFIGQFHVSLKDLNYYLNLKCILREKLLFNLIIM